MNHLRRKFYAALLILSVALTGCRTLSELSGTARPRTMRDVPAQKLAFRLEPDVANLPTAILQPPDINEKLPAIRVDFEQRRKDDALLRTVTSPDGQRALALYGTADTDAGEFKIDLYSVSDGKFLRNIMPKELSGAFLPMVAWSPDSNRIAFIARKAPTPAPMPGLPDEGLGIPPGQEGAPAPTPSTVAPLIPSVPAFSTEQIYVGDRDGYNLKPLTTRDGLIYFHLAWAPDSGAIAALACKEAEWKQREDESKAPAGRPRLITLEGRERLLADQLTEALPVWSPDSSKVATAFENDVAIYDAKATNNPTSARIPLRDVLLQASVAYDENQLKQARAGNANSKTGKPTQPSTTQSSSSPPPSFQPIVHLQWTQPETLYIQTGFVRIYANETINNFMRWHLVRLSPQAALLS